MKQALIGIVALACVFTLLFYIRNNYKNQTPEAPDMSSIDEKAHNFFIQQAADQGLIELNITPNQNLQGTVILTGFAKGYMQEGEFPITIKSPTGETVGTAIAHAQGDWMTTEPVSFSATIETTTLDNGPVTLLLEQSDPSGGEGGKVISRFEIPVIIQN